jgi:hypothetical protein
VLIVNNYNKHQSTPEEAGTVYGTPTGTAGARVGHDTGTAGAPIEQEQQELTTKPLPAPSPSVSPPSPVVLTIPCVGTGSREVGITQHQIERWQVLFPGVDVIAQVKSAVAWSESNLAKRKTASGVPRFLTSWLTRAQNGNAGKPVAPSLVRRDAWEPAPGPPVSIDALVARYNGTPETGGTP